LPDLAYQTAIQETKDFIGSRGAWTVFSNPACRLITKTRGQSSTDTIKRAINAALSPIKAIDNSAGGNSQVKENYEDEIKNAKIKLSLGALGIVLFVTRVSLRRATGHDTEKNRPPSPYGCERRYRRRIAQQLRHSMPSPRANADTVSSSWRGKGR